MARNIGADGRDVYRAVIAFTGRKGDQWTEHEGPYAKLGAARARVTFWSNHMASSGGSATGRVEQAHTVWAPVGEQTDPTAAIRAQAYRDAAAEIEACQAHADAEERDRHGYLDHESELMGAAVRDMAAHLRKRADEIHPATEEPTK